MAYQESVKSIVCIRTKMQEQGGDGVHLETTGKKRNVIHNKERTSGGRGTAAVACLAAALESGLEEIAPVARGGSTCCSRSVPVIRRSTRKDRPRSFG